MLEEKENTEAFIKDAKIVMDIHTIADMYWASNKNLQIYSTYEDNIQFSFKYNMIKFSTWEHRVIEKSLRKMGYEYDGFIVSHYNNEMYLAIHMRTASKKRRLKEGLRWIYRSPIRLYYRYGYWRNYGTWRY